MASKYMDAHPSILGYMDIFLDAQSYYFYIMNTNNSRFQDQLPSCKWEIGLLLGFESLYIQSSL